MTRLAGKRALITGGNRGIGAAVARRLAADGAAVAISYRSGADQAEALVEELTASGATAISAQADVTDVESIRSLVARTADRLGGLDILVSNAGIEYFGPLESITFEDYRRIFDTNVAGQLFVTQAAVERMGPGSRIVLMSSVSARIPVHTHSLYPASKAAVSAMVLNLAPELARKGIGITAIAPGGTRTDMAAEHSSGYVHPALRDQPPAVLQQLINAWGRLAEPDEIAAVVAFLVSPDAAFMTGTTVAADGAAA